jgi:hypothetical protein
MVECEYTGLLNQLGTTILPFPKVKYRMFHGSAFAAQRSSNSTVKRKEKFWTTNDDKGNVDGITAPPNILIIGQDSTSRLNFRRHMTKTVKILESLGAVEMLGYTKGTFIIKKYNDIKKLSLIVIICVFAIFDDSWNQHFPQFRSCIKRLLGGGSCTNLLSNEIHEA